MNSIVSSFLFLTAVAEFQSVVPFLRTNLTRIQRQTYTDGTSCAQPAYPDNGRWLLLHGERRPDAKVSKHSLLKFQCNSGYKLSSKSPYAVCDEEWDLSKMPECREHARTSGVRRLKLPHQTRENCAEETLQEWAEKNTILDKICAKNSTSLYSGGSVGLTYKNLEGNRYYVHGIVSRGLSLDGRCNIQQNSLHTSVAYYYEFVDRNVNKHYAEECLLPPYPDNGRWTIEDDPDKTPGDISKSNTILTVTCDEGFKLSSVSPFIDCESSTEMPTCEKICSPLSAPTGTKVRCKDKRGQKIPCAIATEGSRLWYSCPNGSRKLNSAQRTRKCVNGSWGSSTIECQPHTLKVICTYASWAAEISAYPESFNASLCTHVNYAFIGIWPNGTLRMQNEAVEVDGETRGLYHRVTDMKRRNKDLKVVLSVGGSGATNASIYSSVAANPDKRMAFVESALYYITTYNFDGLDIEWFFPTESDRDNYIALLRDLRQAFEGRGLLLTATVRSDPDFTGYNGYQMNKILDWVIVKTYDMYGGTWSAYTGIHSPLYPSRVQNDWEKARLSLEASGNNWIKRGIDINKLVLSIAFYGRSFTLKDKHQHGLNAPIIGRGPGVDIGVVTYSEICSKYSNWTTVWDDEQKSPYKFQENGWFGFDSKDSVWIKAAYIKEDGFSGVNVWPVDGDDVHGKCGTKQILLKHVHGGLGHQVNWGS